MVDRDNGVGNDHVNAFDHVGKDSNRNKLTGIHKYFKPVGETSVASLEEGFNKNGVVNINKYERGTELANRLYVEKKRNDRYLGMIYIKGVSEKIKNIIKNMILNRYKLQIDRSIKINI